MTARRLLIEEKVRPYPVALVGPEHFRTRAAGPVDPAIVEAPHVSLYCLDHARREALFVETAPDAELSAAPFFFQAQYDAARSLIAVPYEAVYELADRAPAGPRRLALIYSVGRCGSTLVGHAFGRVAGAAVLSEPDVFTQLVGLRREAVGPAGLGPDELSRLIRSCARLLFGRATPAGSRALAVKFRSFAIELAELLQQHLPEARVVFLYRGVAAWVTSSLRAFGAHDPSMAESLAPAQDRLGRLVPLLATQRARLGRVLTPVEAMACQWVSQMERALALRRAGVPMHATRYEDLTAHPQEEFAALFAHCGLPPGPVGALDRVLAEDSQTGTSLARAALDASAPVFDEPQLVELKRVIAELSEIGPDLIIHNGQAR